MAGQKRHDLKKVSLRRRVKRIRWFVATACCTGVIKIWRWGGTIVDVGISSERRRYTTKALVVIYKKPLHSKPVEASHSEPATMASTFKACWGIPPAVKATVSLLQWQSHIQSLLRHPFPRQSKRQWACYNGNVKDRLHHLGNQQSEPATIDVFYGQRHSEPATKGF